MAIGIRAFQWGWEYFYPKDMNLYQRMKVYRSLFIGNSVRYLSDSYYNFKKRVFFENFRNKKKNFVLIPSLFFVTPQSSPHILAFYKTCFGRPS